MSSPFPTFPGEQRPPMSEPGRLTGIFWEPKPVFEDLAARPRWWVPVLLITCLTLVFVFSFSRIVGWDTFLQQEVQNNSRLQQLSLQQQQQIVQQQSRVVGVVSYVGGAVGTVVSLLVVAGALLLMFRMAGATELSFRQAFSITSYSWLPFGLYQVLALVVLQFTRPTDFNLKNPLPFNAGWFLDPARTPAWLVSLGSSLDLFSFWVMALTALGFSVAARKIRYGKAFALVISVWVVYVALKTGWAALFG